MKNLALVESKSLREEHINQIEVLEKVKAIKYLTNDMIVSTKQAADYYEVGKEAIKAVINRNFKEIKRDGLKVLKGIELSIFKGQLQDATHLKYVSAFTIIPRRALLRIGMLLTESRVAEEIRTHLLNSEENKPEFTPETAIKTFRLINKILDEVAAPPENKLETAKNIFGKAGIDIPVTIDEINTVTCNQKLYLNANFFENLMKKNNWSKVDLAKRVGTTRNHIWRLISGTSAVGPTLERKFIKAFPQFQNSLFKIK
ncbi:MAG: hypothetical protein MI740_10270 [Halanaerobiales bacterium]|nr:hypothetical protein [Halanaerobiales bacterium]